MAKNDFKNVEFKKIFKNAFIGMTWVLKIAKHLGTITQKKFNNFKLTKNNRNVLLKNDSNETLEVPLLNILSYSLFSLLHYLKN